MASRIHLEMLSAIVNPPPVSGVSRLSLLDADPDLAECIAVEDREAARLGTWVVSVVVGPGPFEPESVFAAGADGFGALVVSGLVTREVSVGGEPALRLLGPGEIFLDESPEGDMVSPAGAWSASLTTRLAIIDDHLLLAIRRWPRLARALFVRLQQSHDITLMQLAISHQPRVEDRVLALFNLLSANWGRMTAEGVVVPLALTHEAIGRMVGARRPTVTLALRSLGADGRLLRRAGGRWLLGADHAAPRDFQPLMNGQLPRVVLD
jgi:CRP-like cAMP-binding protein